MIRKLMRWLLLLLQTTFLYRFRAVGPGCRLDKSLFVYPGRVSLGQRVYIGRFCYLDGDINIGDFTMLASSVAVVGGDHAFHLRDVLMIDSGRDHWKTTRIGRDCWIGHGAILLNGITIGDGSIVAAGSVVISNVPPFTVVAGNPARVVRPRFKD
jgi:chloramphenicol O-acetyltransferase type B